MAHDGRDVTIRCACGWVASGPRSEVVAATREHGRRIHNMEASDDEIMAMATPRNGDGQPRG